MEDHRSLVMSNSGLPSSMDSTRTPLRTTEAQLSSALEMQNLALRVLGAAHDLNNLMTIIIGHLSQLQEQSFPEDQESAELAMRAADEARKLIAHTLTHHKVTPSSTTPTTYVPSVVDEVLALTQIMWYDKPNLEVSTILAPTPPVRMSSTEVRQVLINLVMNAIAAMPTGGALTIHSNAIGNQIVISISDTGSGIADQLHPVLFQPFVSGEPGGHGIGLAASRALIERAGGRLTVDSQAGRGTTFIMLLPAA